MESIFEHLFSIYHTKEDTNIESIDRLEMEIEKNKQQLKRNFNKKQKKLLLRIVDAKDLINEESNLENFIEGFKIGLKVGYESNKD